MLTTEKLETVNQLNDSSQFPLVDGDSQSLESSDELCLEELESVAGGGCGITIRITISF